MITEKPHLGMCSKKCVCMYVTVSKLRKAYNSCFLTVDGKISPFLPPGELPGNLGGGVRPAAGNPYPIS